MRPLIFSLLFLAPLWATATPPQEGKVLYSSKESEETLNPKCAETPATVDYLDRCYLAFKPGYLYLMDSRARKIYDNGGFAFRAEADYRAYSDYLLIWFDGSYFTKNGHSLGYKPTDTNLQIGSMTLGLKGIYFWNYCALYGGAGPRLFFISVENDSPYVKQHQKKVGIGGGFTAGLLIFPWDRSLGYFDLFADYSLKSAHFSDDGKSSIVRHDVSFSGLTAGLGVGVRF